MKYEGKVYAWINGEYVEVTLEKGDTLHIPKRKPDANGVLPLTDEELKEFSEVVGNQGVYKVCVGENGVAYYMYQIGCTKFNGNAVQVASILWLAERFDLTEG